MPQSFQIPDPNQIASTGNPVVFTISNSTGEGLTGRLAILTRAELKDSFDIPLERAADPAWFTIAAPLQRDFAPDGSVTVAVTPAVPPGTAPGDYLFSLLVVSVVDPDNDATQSPLVTLTVSAEASAPPPAEKKKMPWWIWLLIGLLVLTAVGVGGWLMLRGDGGDEVPAETGGAQAGGAWFAGNWAGTIDGRAAQVQFPVTKSGKNTTVKSARVSFDNGQTFQDLTYVRHQADSAEFKAGANVWTFKKSAAAEIGGWASFDGNQFPIALRRQ